MSQGCINLFNLKTGGAVMFKLNRISLSKSSIFIFVLLFLSVLFVFNPSYTSADGIVIDSEGSVLSEPAQKAAIIWDKDFRKETLIINTSFGIGSLTNFCWVIPIQSFTDPNVKASDNAIFDYLEGLFLLTPRSDWSQYPAQSFNVGASSIEVIDVQKIGVYELATLWADDPNVLTGWLVNNGYNVPANFSLKVKSYTAKPGGYYFVANKINLEDELAGPLALLDDFDHDVYTDLMSDNLTLTDINTLVTTLVDNTAQYIMDGNSYDPNSFIGYSITQYNYNDLYSRWDNGTISSTYLKNEVRTHLTSTYLLKTVLDLFEGAGTPIEITFFPEDPIYPLYLSSMATNYGGIEVYFIGPYTVEDSRNILIHWHYINLTSSIKSELETLGDTNIPESCHYISLLFYRGYMDSLDNDSVFVRYLQSQSTSPSYIIPPYPFAYPYSYPYSTVYSYPSYASYTYPGSITYSSFTSPFSYFGSPSYYGYSGGLYGSSYFSRPYYGSFFGSSVYGGVYGGGVGLNSYSFYGGGFGSSLFGLYGGGSRPFYSSSYYTPYNTFLGPAPYSSSSFFSSWW